MLRPGWNFHNDVALPLEMCARQFFGCTERSTDKIYDADAIKVSSFVEVMIILLREKTSFDRGNEAVDNFISDCMPYWGKAKDSIESEVADELYTRFTDLFK